MQFLIGLAVTLASIGLIALAAHIIINTIKEAR